MAVSRSEVCVLGVLLAAVLLVVRADPDITTDYVVPDDPKSLNASFFTYTGVFYGFENVKGFDVAISKVSQKQVASLTGLGVSTALIEYGPGGLNPPHTHPRGTEVLWVLGGSLTVGLIDTNNQFFGKVLEPGDIFVFPKGLVHYQWNHNKKAVVAYAAFSSANPGTVSLAKTIFGTKIPRAILEEAFKVPAKVIRQLQAPYAPPSPPSAPAPAPAHHS